jgi:hypothetical protein
MFPCAGHLDHRVDKAVWIACRDRGGGSYRTADQNCRLKVAMMPFSSSSCTDLESHRSSGVPGAGGGRSGLLRCDVKPAGLRDRCSAGPR